MVSQVTRDTLLLAVIIFIVVSVVSFTLAASGITANTPLTRLAKINAGSNAQGSTSVYSGGVGGAGSYIVTSSCSSQIAVGLTQEEVNSFITNHPGCVASVQKCTWTNYYHTCTNFNGVSGSGDCTGTSPVSSCTNPNYASCNYNNPYAQTSCSTAPNPHTGSCTYTYSNPYGTTLGSCTYYTQCQSGTHTYGCNLAGYPNCQNQCGPTQYPTCSATGSYNCDGSCSASGQSQCPGDYACDGTTCTTSPPSTCPGYLNCDGTTCTATGQTSCPQSQSACKVLCVTS